MEIGNAVGKPLAVVVEEVPETTTLLIQDVSPRVGREAAYWSGHHAGWTVIASCADGLRLDDSSIVEVAVIPSESFTNAVQRDVARDEFLTAVDCEDRPYR